MNDKRITSGAILLFIILILGSLSFYIEKFHSGTISNDTQDWAAFVAYIGGILGVGLSIVGTILLYRTFIVTSNNARESASFAKETMESARVQQLENAFFNMLNVQSNIANIIGYDKLGRAAADLNSCFRNSNGTYIQYPTEIGEIQKKVNAELLSILNNRYYDLGHYFRHLFNIIKYIDESGLTLELRKKYVNLVQAQMSSDELFITFFNVVSANGKKRFYPLILKYPDFFENMDSKNPTFDEIKMLLFPQTIFKETYSENQDPNITLF